MVWYSILYYKSCNTIPQVMRQCFSLCCCQWHGCHACANPAPSPTPVPLALHPLQAVPCWVWLRKIMVHALTLCFLAGGVAPKGKAVSVPPFWEPTLEPTLDPAWLLPSCDSLSLMICSFMASFPLNFSFSSAGSSSKRGTSVCPEGLTD